MDTTKMEEDEPSSFFDDSSLVYSPKKQSNKPRKPRPKITLQDKMNIIREMQKGKRRVDVAREYGLSPAGAGYIFNRKDHIVEQYEMKCIEEQGESTIGLGESLMNWFEFQINTNITVTESLLKSKAKKLAEELKYNNFKCTDEWLEEFYAANNIIRDVRKRHELGIEKLDWKKMCGDFETSDIYVMSGFALLHSLNYCDYINNRSNYLDSCGKHVSLLLATNIIGTDKRKPVVIGQDHSLTNIDSVRSFPAQYVTSNASLITRDVIVSILNEWDKQQRELDKKIAVILDTSAIFLNNVKLENIKIVNVPFDKTTISKMFNIVSKSLKYHYRRLTLLHGSKLVETGMCSMDMLRLLNLAWVSVAVNTIHRAFNPPLHGLLRLNIKNHDQVDSEENDQLSLVKWYETHHVPVRVENHHFLDEFLNCDENIQSFSMDPSCKADLNNSKSINIDKDAPTSLVAYDAMKRLMQYLESTEASESTLQAAQIVENHTECGALNEVCAIHKSNTKEDKGNK